MPLSPGLQANLPYIRKYAAQYGVPLNYALAQARTEDSTGSPTITTNKSAPPSQWNIGQYQVSPDVFAQYGPKGGSITNSANNIQAGLAYLSSLYKQFGSWPLAFAAYNAGPGRVSGDITAAKNLNRATQGGPVQYKQIVTMLGQQTRGVTPAYVTAITGSAMDAGYIPGQVGVPSSGASAGNPWHSFLIWLHKAENGPKLSAAPWTWGSDTVGILEWAGVKIALITLGLAFLLIGVVYLMQSVPQMGGGEGSSGSSNPTNVNAPVLRAVESTPAAATAAVAAVP